MRENDLARQDWSIRPIEKSAAKDFIAEHHYAHKTGEVITECFGLFYKGDLHTLHGVAAWNPPALGAAKVVAPDHRTVLGLSRFCLVPTRPNNAGSFLIAGSIRMLDRKWGTLLTFADTAEDHTGIIYKASNWSYYGLTGKQPVYRDPGTGEQVSRKRGPRTYNRAEMEEMGYEFQGNYSKHRFVYPRNRRLIVRPAIQLELAFSNEGKIVKPR